MFDTPRANRLHIAIFGKRNAGKSSLINAITGQEIALVSDIAGTTTDPVYKSMELLPLGPVIFIDTAGIDDQNTLGELRIKKTKEVLEKTDLALLVFSALDDDPCIEKKWYQMLTEKKIPTIGVINKIDIQDRDTKPLEKMFDIPFVKVSARSNIHIDSLKELMRIYSPSDFEKATILGDIIQPKDTIVLVAPQDIQAPKGRLILPQVQVMRDILDHDAMALMVKDSELEDILKMLNTPPNLVITDSQVFAKVNSIVPPDIPLTSFSILMARYKGDLRTFIEGARVISRLKSGDNVLIAEACTHHPMEEDIAREKIPNWLKKTTQADLNITVKAGVDFAEDLYEYSLIIHCGACMFNQKQMMTRIFRSKMQNVPITNYGIAIAYMNGILDRVTRMFF